MSLRHHRTPTALALTIAVALASIQPAIAQDDWSLPGGSRHETPPPEEETLPRPVPGSRIAWLLDDGELGDGTLVALDDSTLIVAPGRSLDRDRCQALWRSGHSRAGAIGRGLGTGVALGLVVSSALFALYYDDSPSSFENLGPGLGGLMAVTLGAILGTVAGTVGPSVESWDLIDAAPGAQTWRVKELPRPAGRSGPRWPRRPWLELAGVVGSVGWQGDSQGRGGSGVRTTLWFPLAEAVELGAAVTVTAASRLPDGGGLAGAALLRAGTDLGASQPYVSFGLGQYGMLGNMPGFCLAGGLRLPLSGGWTTTLEITSVHGLRSLAGDNPGMASVSLGVGRSLGGGGS